MYYGARAEKEEILLTIYSRLDVSRAIIATVRNSVRERERERERKIEDKRED